MGGARDARAACFADAVGAMSSRFGAGNGLSPILNLSAKLWVGVVRLDAPIALIGDTGAIVL